MTTSEYAIIRYVPDPITGERLNIGVIVFAGSQVKVRFLADWKRVQKFAIGEDLNYLRKIQESLELISLESDSLVQLSDVSTGRPRLGKVERLKDMVRDWNHTVQFSQVAPSMEQPDRLLDRLSKRYLVEGQRRSANRMTKTQVLAAVTSSLADRWAMREDLDYNKMVKRGPSVIAVGHICRDIDIDLSISLEEGKVDTVGFAVSFQSSDVLQVEHQWERCIYALADVQRAEHRNLFFAPPISGNKHGQFLRQLEMAQNSANSAGVQMISLLEVADWSENLTERALRLAG